jgi:hypothetical protein
MGRPGKPVGPYPSSEARELCVCVCARLRECSRRLKIRPCRFFSCLSAALILAMVALLCFLQTLAALLAWPCRCAVLKCAETAGWETPVFLLFPSSSSHHLFIYFFLSAKKKDGDTDSLGDLAQVMGSDYGHGVAADAPDPNAKPVVTVVRQINFIVFLPRQHDN